MDDESHLVQFQVYKVVFAHICIHLWVARDGEFELSNPCHHLHIQSGSTEAADCSL